MHGQFLKTLPAGGSACALQLAHTPKKAAGETAEEKAAAEVEGKLACWKSCKVASSTSEPPKKAAAESAEEEEEDEDEADMAVSAHEQIRRVNNTGQASKWSALLYCSSC